MSEEIENLIFEARERLNRLEHAFEHDTNNKGVIAEDLESMAAELRVLCGGRQS